jgi:hypothetical protein
MTYVSAPTACPTCEGYGLILRPLNADVTSVEPCPDCTCVICGQRTAAIGGECGECYVAEDTAAVRRADQ